MNKLLTITSMILTIMLLATSAHAQVKDSVSGGKPKYKKFVKVEISDVKFMVQALDDYKRLVIYDPLLSAETKVSTIQQIQSYVIEVTKRLPIDSVMILPDSIKVKQYGHSKHTKAQNIKRSTNGPGR